MTHEAREKELLALLREHGADLPDGGPIAEQGPLIDPSRHVEFARALKARGWTLYLYCVASHWPLSKAKKADEAPDPEHHEIAFGLRSVGAGSHVARWRVRIDAGETIATLAPVFAGADWQEREQYDLVGVVFEGHPDLRRLMLPEEWDGHPLRKDYAIDTRHPPWR